MLDSPTEILHLCIAALLEEHFILASAVFEICQVATGDLRELTTAHLQPLADICNLLADLSACQEMYQLQGWQGGLFLRDEGRAHGTQSLACAASLALACFSGDGSRNRHYLVIWDSCCEDNPTLLVVYDGVQFADRRRQDLKSMLERWQVVEVCNACE